MIDMGRIGAPQNSIEEKEVVIPSSLPITCLILIGLRDNIGQCYLLFKVKTNL